MEWDNGDYAYFFHGEHHRLDGWYKNYDDFGYYIMGEPYSEEDYWNHPDVIEYNKWKEELKIILLDL